ncbi:hypothetical protein EN962_06790 [Mesorhizobium sp. M7A.F.Ca.CA.001.09.2.1]|nr:hypothetical protein EN981_14780 [Mesorhizobium sp. M7A.F.Ca.CA.001.13.2.1]RUY68984.1 hypothetical protein EN980_12805 [Mesorhizobium sp. M7A.F.Ca.CA.001.13.1.1]RUY68999.1 hypothetical protein EN965_12545 [Mesorhizobium sp. M7A.F.Ca.CA.001.05.1.1]RUY80103.1 hypothetical protein EN962_06790 [Mesorhizobium sp. M7A.F.Ca.CA.001.09.2.1]RUZ08528.1 hypothetical protein EN955_07810 [Mesorhizobium sp. M7A.F.Ca.CA.001.04.2.1]RUZ21032.1 hypothetical protein EN961_14660 [Mesorhizobium sp. M7A.F.Ca.CA.0
MVTVRRWNRRSPLAAGPDEFVILGRSKERSDAAQTLGSMPRRWSKSATDQQVYTGQRAVACSRHSRLSELGRKVTAWIPGAAEQLQGFPRRRFATAIP